MTRLDRRSVLVGAGLWVLVDVLRVWTPSLITIFGRAAETPAELIGAFALAVGAVPLVLTLVARRWSGRADAALLVLVVARVVLQATDGDRPQLVAASVGVAAGIWWLAEELGSRRTAIGPGIALGMLLATTAHAALGTYGAPWRRDLWGIAVLVLQVAVVLAARSRDADPADPPPRTAALLVFPVLLLDGVLLANAGRASGQAGWLGPALTVLGCALGLALALAPRGRTTTAVAAVLLVVLTAVGMLAPLSGFTAVLAALPFLLGPGAAAHLLAAAAAGTGRSGGATAVAGGAVLWVALLFAYYAGYDLGYRADWLVVAVAVVVAVLAARGTVASASVPDLRGLAPFAVGAVLLALVGPLVTLPRHDPPAAHGDRVRVMAWNLRMGYGIDGRFDAAAVARTIRDQHPDVVLLSEIDRGWLLNGGQDQLRILSRLTGMHAAFGAAADPVWGDAVLSRVPVQDVVSRAFPSYGAVTGAEALEVHLRIAGTDYAVVSTHLQPGAEGTDDTVGQAAGLARLMRRASEEGVAVVGGDLNTTPDSTAWKRLEDGGLADALAPARPLLTSSSDDLTEQIDHLFVSEDVTTADPHAVRSLLSDHLPVVVDLVSP